ncbi:MAG TPA: ATP synthase F1 subunit epsilon [Candidatus Fournierella excrementigallinarum]|uniref:ATP synthase F1 subunit epsilon n=1 Tax=Candidatus Allofournierella excrementigallinarum TaxID=2838592 RepID=UPI001F95CFAD|nr:ATP synthase F1 subunit epsilon [Candidatus Fournierella excrementigallinarum]
MTSFPLQIVTPGGQAYDGMAQKLFCRTITGDVAILARHCDYLTAVGMGEARVTAEDGTVRRAACIGGMLSVAGGRVRLMANTFEWAEDIDAARAEASEAQARRQLEQTDLSARDRELAAAKLRRAQVRQSVAARR